MKTINIKYLLLFQLMVLACSVSFAKPVSFVTAKDQMIAPISWEQRQRLQGFSLNIRDAIPMTEYELKDYRVTLFEPVARLIEEVVQNKGIQTLNSALIQCQEMRNAAEALANDQNPKLQELRGYVRMLCEKLERPEFIYYHNELIDPKTSTFMDIDSMLEFALTPHMLQNVAFSFFPNDINDSLRSSFLKIRIEKIDRDFKTVLKSIDSLLKSNPGQQANLQVLKQKVVDRQNLVRRLDEEGRKQFQAEGNPSSLPYKNIAKVDRRNLTMYLSAVYWRMRGGGLVDKPLGTQATRYYFVNLAYNTLASLNGIPNAFAFGADQFARVAIRGWGDWMDMGDNKKDEPLINDLINMTDRGIYQTRGGLDLLRSASMPTDGLEAAGLQMGPCYLAVWDKLVGVFVLKDPPLPFRGYIDWPTAWGEYCFGAALGYGISTSALYK